MATQDVALGGGPGQEGKYAIPQAWSLTAEFVFYLMLGQLSWTFFASSAAMSTGAIIDNAGLLKSVVFPRAILPIGTVLFNFAQYLLTVSVFLPAMMIWYREPLSAPMLLFPVFLALQVVFTIGIALILATWTAFVSVSVIMFRAAPHIFWTIMIMLGWVVGVTMQIIAGAIARMRR